MKVTGDVVLKRGKDVPLKRGHLWVFSGAIEYAHEGVENGDLVRVINSHDELLGYGHFHEGGSIAVRIISQDNEISESFWKERIQSCKDVRSQAGFPSVDTNCYRLVHGEGDGLPGLIIDVYDKVIVVQCHTSGMEKSIVEIKTALQQLFEPEHIAVQDGKGNYLENSKPSGTTRILEYGVPFEIDWEDSQKTGFFLDQRENRKLVGTLSKGKKVLNLFCYTGGFSSYALHGGATEVISVDISRNAMTGTDRNIELLNASGTHTSITADVMKYAKEMPEDADIVIVDPPAFAKNRKAKHNAVIGYKRLNTMVAERMKPGSILFTYSCSQVVDTALFRNTIVSAVLAAGKRARILHQLHQPADHPVNLLHPESEYLKGLVLRIE